MAIIVNTNIPALQIQQTLGSATDKMNQAMLRMATGSKINSAADDAAGMAVSTNMSTQISGSKTAQANAQIGSNLLSTQEGALNVIGKHLARIRDLAEQSANGTYDSKARGAMLKELDQRFQEINRIGSNTDFNGIKLFDTATTGSAALNLQVGAGSDTSNQISLGAAMFATVTVSSLGVTAAAVTACFGATSPTAAQANTLLSNCDAAISAVTDKKTTIGGYQNRLTSAIEGLKVTQANLTSARSTIQDADIAEESASYVQSQILQQASASLLAQANQAPSIAVNLV
jgi:flagellin